MIKLEFFDHSDLDKVLYTVWPETIPDFKVWLNELDYVTKAHRDYITEQDAYLNTLYFETEQDKMFFLLKYS